MREFLTEGLKGGASGNIVTDEGPNVRATVACTLRLATVPQALLYSCSATLKHSQNHVMINLDIFY